MTFPDVTHARHIRDGGIDAMAALNHALLHAIDGLDEERQLVLKKAFGEVMGDIVVKIVNPAVKAFPELETNQEGWVAIARAKAVERADKA